MHRIALALLAALLAWPAAAQVATLGTTQAGATNQLSVAIAKVVSEKAGGLQLRTQAMAGAAQYIPAVNAGEVELGVANIVETAYAVKGEVILPGRPNPDIRMVARLFPFLAGLVVADSSPVKTTADLRGQPVPANFSGNPLGRVIMDGYLATAGLTMSDVKPVPVTAFPRMFEAFKQGQIVTSIVALGSGNVQDFAAALGGVRYLSFPDSPPAVAAMTRHLPQAYIIEVKPAAGLVGIAVPTNLIGYDYVLFAGTRTPDAVVEQVVAALFRNQADLKATGPLWREFEPRLMSKDVGIAYHPGAAKAYQALGATVPKAQ